VPARARALLQGVCLVLGSSLQIAPANEIPAVTPDQGGELAIVNLQV
jgi:mono-ADP-ribosyltransferase sirtuin 6